MHDKPAKDEGFTLIEMMAVLMIIGLLMGAVAVTVLGNTDKARVERVNLDIQTYSNALERYYMDMGDFPPEEYGLAALKSLPNGVDNEERYSSDGYIKKVRNDPWGNPYVYIYPGEHGRFDILSYGKDGQPGGEEMDADLTSWDEEE